jgi:hypothetical protein
VKRYQVYCFNHDAVPLSADRCQAGCRLRRFDSAVEACAYAITERARWTHVVVSDGATDKVVVSYLADKME